VVIWSGSPIAYLNAMSSARNILQVSKKNEGYQLLERSANCAAGCCTIDRDRKRSNS
jgi:hypothetical protein